MEIYQTTYPSYLWEGGGGAELQIFLSNFLSLPMFSYEHHYFNIIRAMNITIRFGFESGLYYLLGYASVTFGKASKPLWTWVS